MTSSRGFFRCVGVATLSLTSIVVSGAASGDDLPAKGEIEIKTYKVEGSPAPKMRMRAVLESPPNKVWQIVSDCARYKERLPRVAASKLLSKVGNVHTCEVTIAMPFPLSNLTAVTEAVHEENEKGMSRKWKLARGDYRSNTGSWEIKPVPDGSLVTYTIHAEPNTSVPDWIREEAQKRALPELMERVRAEASKLP